MLVAMNSQGNSQRWERTGFQGMPVVPAAAPFPPNSTFISLSRWCQLTGIAPVTAWRYRKRGWLRTLNICGRVYVTAASIHAFLQRAEAGEFARTPAIARHSRVRRA